MRHTCIAALFLGLSFTLVPTTPMVAQKAAPKKTLPNADKAALKEPFKRLLKGNYEEARTAFAEAVKKESKLAPMAAIGIADSYRLTGDYDKAIATLNDAVKVSPEYADLLAARADHLYESGKWDEAEKDADAALAKNENQLLARWTKGRIIRDRGNTDEADKIFRAVVRYYTARSNADDDITDPEELVCVAQCGAENARWHNLSRQFSFILNEVLKDALKSNPDYWHAEQLAGMLLLEKYNRPDAIEAFDKVLKLNPKAVDPLVGKAQSSVIRFDLKDADNFADQALKLNPKHPGALRVKADIQIIAGDYPAAEKLLKEAEAVNPRESETLGRIAALHLLQKRTKEFEALVKTIESFDSKPGSFYYELAACLDERKQYTIAEGYYKKSTELRPLLAAPRTHLGMLYLRLGDEKQGRQLLDAAFKADPFNVRVANSRKVLTHLETYKTVITEHYELRYDEKTDKILGEFVADYLEQSHAELKKQFNYEPQGKILIEVFNSHEMFSGRTVGLPDLHTIGACTGRVVAMASPKARGLTRPFNWGRVVRHELTHIFNLAQTDFQCPHWLTEGLAVMNEKMARSPMWSRILAYRHASGTLLNLDTILLGFVRPKSQDEWTLAYCQSQIYVEYTIKTHGIESIAKLLDVYKTGADTTTAIKTACGVDKATFEAGYKKYVDNIVKNISTAKTTAGEKALTFEELQDAVAANPDDLDLKARLADQHYRMNKKNDAKKLIDDIWEKKPGHPTAAVVRAKLLTGGGDEDGAKETLELALKENPENVALLRAIGNLQMQNKNYEEAAKMFERGRKLTPEGDWAEQLAKIYKMTKDDEKLIPILKEVVSHDPDDLDARIRLAKASVDAKQFVEAEFYSRDALLIDVTNTEAKDLLLESLKAQNKNDEADKIQKRYEK